MNRAAKRKTRQVRRTKIRKPTVSIIRVAPVIEKPWEIGPDQITILKNSICKGATDDELKYCLIVAQRYKLDPFKRQIWFVPRWDSKADNGKGGKGATVYTPQVGIDGLLMCAARDHRSDYGSVSLPEFGPMVEVEWTDEGKTRTFKAPEWALVKVWKKGVTEPTEAQAYWDEYAPAKLDKAPFWTRMPRRMIAKCATALAIRQAYPDLGGVYIPEECEKIDEGFTESGRKIVTTASSVSGNASEYERLKNRTPEEIRAEARAQLGTRWQEPKEPHGVIELDWSEEASPVVRGEIAGVLETLKLNMHLSWGKDNWWHCEPRDAEALKAICAEFGYELKEILPAKFPTTASNPGATASGAVPRSGKSASGGEVPASSPDGGSTVKENPKPTNAVRQEPVAASKGAEGNKPRSEPEKRPKPLPRAQIPFVVKAVHPTASKRGLEVTVDTGAKFYAFDNRKMGEDGEKLFDLLVTANGKECIFATTKNQTKDKREFINIVALLKMGEREWEESGMPILRRVREPGED